MNNNSNFKSNTPGRMRDFFSRPRMSPKPPRPPMHPVENVGAGQAANNANERAKEAAAPARAPLAPQTATSPDNAENVEAPMPFDRMRRALRGWKSPEPAPPVPTFRKLVQRLQAEARDFAQIAQTESPNDPPDGMIRLASRDNSPAENIVSDASVATDSSRGDGTLVPQKSSQPKMLPVHTHEEIGNRFIKEKGIDYSGIKDDKLRWATERSMIRLSSSPLGRELLDNSLKNGWNGKIIDAATDNISCAFVKRDSSPDNPRPIEFSSRILNPNVCNTQDDVLPKYIGRTLVHELFHYGYDRLFTPWRLGQFNIPNDEAYNLASQWQNSRAYKEVEVNGKSVMTHRNAGGEEFIDKYFLRYPEEKP